MATPTGLLSSLAPARPSLRAQWRQVLRAQPLASSQRLRQPQLSGRSTSGSSTAKSAKPIVLEKPAKFNPPSHGVRLLRKGAVLRHYGGSLTADEVATQKKRDYPGMMAPRGSWSYWVWNSRWLHLLLTTGTLVSLAVYTFTANMRHNSPFAEMMPAASDFVTHPVQAFRTLADVIRLHEAHQSGITAEKRRKRVDDVAKRSAFRKAHGLEDSTAFGGWTAKTDADAMGPALPATGEGAEALRLQAQQQQQGRKKFWGIF